ncbi:uncharacterized protein [Parasteatoda tepidariorum]|uniref:uncharacterized protein n=1 Tax=Parasteatoda tepidariorum TaxID=114398 RepID=UPI0039BC4C9B
MSLHVFCDASKLAYGTCVFVRVESTNEPSVKVNLVQAKSRVAPLKPLTVPRLELLACCIGSRLLANIIKDLNLNNIDIYCWTDSTTVLSWIKRELNWGIFVQNRVKEIRSLTSHTMWRHIPGSFNPADLASRGCSAEQLIERRWWEGPNWLYENEQNWPKSFEAPDENLVNSELRKSVIVNLSKNDNVYDNWYYKYFSSYKKIVNMIAWIFRFYNNCRNLGKNCSKFLSVNELDRAEKSLILLIQKDSFTGINDNKLRQLRPFFDNDGIIRAKTNLVFREDKSNFIYPVILPSDHPVVKLLIINCHIELLHAGTTMIMSHLREKFWILKSRKTIRNCIRQCVKCLRFNATKCNVTPGILPKVRVNDASVFEIVGVDLAGPLYLKNGKKSYIVLYTCAVYRAIHLELVTLLTTEAFFQSLRRFIARRGRPSVIYSDNGTNFVGAQKILYSIEWDKLASKAAEHEIRWRFNPPSAA